LIQDNESGKNSESNSRNKFFKLDKNVFFLGITSLFADISSEMVYPYLVIFLAATLQVSTVSIGFIEGLAESTASITKVFSGWFSDRLKRRKGITVVGYGVGLFSRPLLALTRAWPQVAFLRFFDRVGKGIRTSPRDAMIADVTPVSKRGRAFGLHRAMDTTGAILGPGAAYLTLLFFGSTNYRLLFLIAGIPALIAVLVIAGFVREKPRIISVDGEGEKISRNILKDLSKFSGKFKAFALITFIFALGNSSDVFLILRAKDLGVSSLMIAPLYLSFNITYALFSTPAGIISDRVGRPKIIIAGYLIFALVYLGFALADSYYYLLPLFILYGIYPALTEGVQRAFAADLVSPDLRGTGLGAFHFTVGIAAFPASLFGGLLWNYISPSATFIFGAVIALLSALLLLILFPHFSSTTS